MSMDIYTYAIPTPAFVSVSVVASLQIIRSVTAFVFHTTTPLTMSLQDIRTLFKIQTDHPFITTNQPNPLINHDNPTGHHDCPIPLLQPKSLIHTTYKNSLPFQHQKIFQ